MIHRQGYDGPITFECDECGREMETGFHNLPEALNSVRGYGWTAKKIEDNWYHTCSFECQKKLTRENRDLPRSFGMSREDALQWLGLKSTANKPDIEAAYWRLTQVCHRGRGGTPALEELIKKAYNTLK